MKTFATFGGGEMTQKHDLTIKSVTVEIKVLRVDGHKMTKAVFGQIRSKRLFTKEDIELSRIPESKRKQVLGFVWDAGWHILWIDNGEPRKQYIYVLEQKNAPDFMKKIISQFDQLFIAT